MLTYLLIFLAICSIIGPALLLLPSRRQREQVALRAAARKLGLQVELARVEDPDPDPARYRTLSGKALPREVHCVALRRNRRRDPHWRERPPPAWQLIRTSGAGGPGLPAGWRWQIGAASLLSAPLQRLLQQDLETLPGDVLAVGEQQLRLSVYWLERSGDAGLEQIAAFMERALGVPLTDPEEEPKGG